jgi:formate hydrogenlyase subunit 4
VTGRVLHVLSLLVMPFVLTGLINRTKALWSGRKGPPILQSAYDAIRLLRKSSVYSSTTTPLFRIAPWIFVLTALGSAAVTPLLGTSTLTSFPFDFVWFAYVWSLGRVAIMLAAMDTGSSFEGMGVAREATFSTLLEPALFLVIGALCLTSGTSTLREALIPQLSSGNPSLIIWLGAVTALFIVLQVETARMPVDDPTTHLELTMIHEVMILDHSGPDLAAIQYGSAVKLYVGTAILANLVNPWAGTDDPLALVMNLAGCAGVAVVLGTVESLIARIKIAAVPKYIAVALIAASIALLSTAWQPGAAL